MWRPAADPLRVLAYALAPRPVVLVTTVSGAGVVNVAPFSMVTPVSADPPLVALGIASRKDGGAKTTLANILAVGEFVLNGVRCDVLPAAVRASVAEGPSFLEPFETAPSECVSPPRLVEAPFHLECRLVEVVRPRRCRTDLVVGEVVAARISDSLLRDGEPGPSVGDLPGHLGMLAPGDHLFSTGAKPLRVRAQGDDPAVA